MPTNLSHFPYCSVTHQSINNTTLLAWQPGSTYVYDLVDNEIKIPSSTAIKYIGCAHLLFCTCSLSTYLLTYSIIQPNYDFGLRTFDFLATLISQLKISVQGCHQLFIHFPPSTHLSTRIGYSYLLRRRFLATPRNIQITIWIKTAAHLPITLLALLPLDLNILLFVYHSWFVRFWPFVLKTLRFVKYLSSYIHVSIVAHK